MKALHLLALALACVPLAACFETYHVDASGISGVRFGTDTGAQSFESKGDGKFSYTLIKNNNSKSFKEGASLTKHLSTVYGAVTAAGEQTAQVVSNNALKGKQATEATKQQAILSAPTKYLPAEGEAVSRAGGAVVIP